MSKWLRSEGRSEIGLIAATKMIPPTNPSSNWLALQKALVQHGYSRKRRKVDRGESSDKTVADTLPLPPKRHEPDDWNKDIDLETTEVKNGESIAALRRMVLGQAEYKTGSQTAPGKYLALDCEMVGVGISGNESSLARVSIVNYMGAIVLDVFVRQRERIVDYRTQWSGVRSADLGASAKPFKEVQETVAELVKDRVLVGHAIYNDLRALLLSHPSQQIRDTQSLAYKYHVIKSRRPALRVLVKQELGIVIQGGEHSSVTDARATMAIFRLYKKQWDIGFRPLARIPMKSNVESPGEKAVALGRSSSLSITSGQKRDRSPPRFDDDVTDEITGAGSSLSRLRTLSPASPIASYTTTQHPSPVPLKRCEQRGEPRPEGCSACRKGTPSGISTAPRRVNRIKERRGKDGRTGNGVGKSSVVVNSKVGNWRGGDGEKWWRSLGGGKNDSVKL